MSRGARRLAERRGRRAEWVAALWLMAKGYRILGQRVRTGFGEIDIAALRGDILAIVEVKARASLAQGLNAVGPMQRGRLGRAAEAIAGRWGLGRARLRHDVIVIAPWALPVHVRGAWLEGD